MNFNKIVSYQREIDNIIETECERTRLVVTHQITEETVEVILYISQYHGIFIHDSQLAVIAHYTQLLDVPFAYKKTLGNYTLISYKHKWVEDYFDQVYSNPDEYILLPGEE